MTEAEWYKVTKDVVQALAWIGTVVAAVFTAFKVIKEIQNNRQQKQEELQQRAQELTWRQAKLAKEIIDDMFKNAYAMSAMKMLESPQRQYEIETGKIKLIRFADVIDAISTEQPLAFQNDEQLEKYEIQRYIRDSFDHFFAVMQALEHYISIGLIRADDVKFPFNYYAKKIDPYRQAFERYLTEDQSEESLLFLKRFLNTPKLESRANDGASLSPAPAE